MRIREGEFAYDIEPVNDTSTMLFKHFRILVERLSPSGDQKLYEGTAKTFDEAREIADKKIQELIASSNMKRAG